MPRIDLFPTIHKALRADVACADQALTRGARAALGAAARDEALAAAGLAEEARP